MLTPGIGDVLVVSTGKSCVAKLIKIGQVLRGQSGLNNHVAIAHHMTDGVLWGVEGKPGGVGWADLSRYVKDPRTVCNNIQPKTLVQRTAIADASAQMLGTKYDWAAIAHDSLTALHLPDLFKKGAWKDGLVPGHVVCSSFASYLYEKAGLAHPKSEDRYTMPGDWAEFVYNASW